MSINIHSRDENYPQDNHQSKKMNNLIKQKVQNNLKNNLELIPLTSIEKQKILEKADKTTKNILTKKPQLIPTHQVRIDGIDFYFGPKIKFEDKILFFVDKNGHIEPRVSRISGSGQKMHIFPGYDAKIIKTPKGSYPSGKRYSKGDTNWKMDYESGVITDSRIEKILQNLPDETEYIPRFGDFLAMEGYLSKNYETLENLQEFEKINISTRTNHQNLTYSLGDTILGFKNQSPEIQKWYQENPIKGMKNIFEWVKLDEKIFQKFLENNKEFPKGTKYQKISNSNDEIQKYNIEVGEYNGKIMYAKFCYNKNKSELCWIESFNIVGSPITSFGIPKHRISGGIFTTKPAEYFSQIPQFLQNDIKNKNQDIEFYSDDVEDIRKYLQENPFIIAFKKLRQENPEIFK